MLIYHKATEAEKILMAEWKYPGEYAVYNSEAYVQQKAKKSGFANPQNHFYSFYDDARIVGYINLREREEKVYLGIGVHPDHCGKGYGRQIIGLAHEICREIFGDKPLHLCVRTWNMRAVRCYQHAGFCMEGEPFRQMTPSGEAEFFYMIRK